MSKFFLRTKLARLAAAIVTSLGLFSGGKAAVSADQELSCVASAVAKQKQLAGDYLDVGAYAFHDKNLSASRDFSCASCHDGQELYTSRVALLDSSYGLANRNVQSLLNIREQPWYFWDGRTDSLAQAVVEPIFNRAEMDLDESILLDRLKADDAYKLLLESSGNEVTIVSLRNEFSASMNGKESPKELLSLSLASFVATLVSCRHPSSPARKLTESEENGRNIFLGKGGCANCHFGERLTDDNFHNIRVKPLRNMERPDSGRYAAVQSLKEASPLERHRRLKLLSTQWGAFRTPSLVNVSETYPYMHQGQLKTLEDVVDYYSEFEGALPEDHHYRLLLKPALLTESEKINLTAYLRTMTHEIYTCVTMRESGSPDFSECRVR